jgi:hypothetical protein
MNVADAHQAVLDAEENLQAAEQARDAARVELDEALRVAGWNRLLGAGIGPVYERHPSGDVLPLAEVLSYELRSVA